MHLSIYPSNIMPLSSYQKGTGKFGLSSKDKVTRAWNSAIISINRRRKQVRGNPTALIETPNGKERGWGGVSLLWTEAEWALSQHDLRAGRTSYCTGGNIHSGCYSIGTVIKGPKRESEHSIESNVYGHTPLSTAPLQGHRDCFHFTVNHTAQNTKHILHCTECPQHRHSQETNHTN